MAPKFKILLYESMHARGTEVLAEKCELVYATSLDEKNLIAQAADVDGIIIRANGAVTRALIESAPRLKVIGRHGVGLDAIDLRCAKERGVKVVFTPTANTESVAEHFVGMAIMLAKMIRTGDIALRTGDWAARNRLIGTELHGKALGVLGFGRIGRQTARICRNGFAMNVIYYDVCDYPAVEKELQAKRVSGEEVFEQSDFISVNLPLLPSTRHFVNAKLIRLMKPTAFLINMARGPVWNEEDVAGALREKRIAGVGSDVYEVEPVPADHPLLKMDNFVGTPHMSAHSEEAMIRMSLVASDVVAVLEGREPEYPVTV
ncbi:hydroxyacid dehydrogenase [Syntrophobacter fumaroxidans]|uniref:D-isomer specific 2-hydroxyacid dehydrogenase, NAD-binding n=1 Tax=Syntrophobacter fumaroxidans (strain DSM 10017 / MPOB) TaxID=335543 RepID=A0LN07_SYNFM|nr:hydroxyacid dehydrogenase [Syntrophobacter fumaroxidans]ABK18809.1 D-isomer specific 2-hydroxyacid dehydrogenase, NAD-binding [Syntrophobacter fumaroxidans MPOB]